MGVWVFAAYLTLGCGMALGSLSWIRKPKRLAEKRFSRFVSCFRAWEHCYFMKLGMRALLLRRCWVKWALCDIEGICGSGAVKFSLVSCRLISAAHVQPES